MSFIASRVLKYFIPNGLFKLAPMRVCAAIFSILAAAGGNGAAAEPDDGAPQIKLVIPLKDGAYSVRDFARRANEQLRMDFNLEGLPDLQRELTLADRLALLAFSQAGAIRVEVLEDQFTLWLPDAESEVFRRDVRELLERFGLKLDEWPEGMGLKLPKKFDPNRRTVLLIHGLESGRAELEYLAKRFREEGIQVLTFEFPNDGPLAWSGQHLSGELSDLHARFSDLRLAIVAHSMGGLVARHALETPELNPECVTDLVTLGTPHRGTALAEYHVTLELLYRLQSVGRATPGDARPGVLKDGLGEAGADIRTGSQFLLELNDRPPPPGVSYHAAIGRRSFFTDEERQDLIRIVGKNRPSDLSLDLRQRLARSLQADEMCDGLGDGVVSVRSALPPHPCRSQEFELDHNQLLRPAKTSSTDSDPLLWALEGLGWRDEEADNVPGE